MRSDPSISAIQTALRAQDWTHALTLIQQSKSAPLGRAEREALHLAEAAALRSIGRLMEARDIYSRLLAELDRNSSARAEALHGLAECYLGAGDATNAERLAAASLEGAGADRTLRMRCVATHARAVARRDLGAALALVREEFTRSTPPGSARAHLRFCEAEIHLCQGDLERARRALGVARADAQANDASRTVADVLRREASLVVLGGHDEHHSQALTGLVHAERLYAGLGDRSRDLVLTARAELSKHRGQLARAAREFQRAAWAAAERRDHLQVAHNLLGLSDTLRLSGTPDLRHLDRAQRIYRRFDLAWGLFYARLIVASSSRANGDTATARAAEAVAREILAGRRAELGACEVASLADPAAPLRLLFPR